MIYTVCYSSLILFNNHILLRNKNNLNPTTLRQALYLDIFSIRSQSYQQKKAFDWCVGALVLAIGI